MNVLLGLLIVQQQQHVQILKEALVVLVILVILELVQLVMVSFFNFLFCNQKRSNNSSFL